jgi:hypothetical protein
MSGSKLLPVRRQDSERARDSAGEMGGVAEYFDKAAKWAGRSGTIIGAGLSAFSISQGASPSSAAVGFGAGFGTGVVIGAGVSAAVAAGVITAPAWGPVLMVAGGSALAGWGASAAYENFVPQVTRDRFDEGFHDVWSAVGELFA